jgi:hypothetical protein
MSMIRCGLWLGAGGQRHRASIYSGLYDEHGVLRRRQGYGLGEIFYGMREESESARLSSKQAYVCKKTEQKTKAELL